MTVAELFHCVNLAGVRLVNIAGELRLRGPAGVITAEIRAGATEHKATLLSILPAAAESLRTVQDAEDEEERAAIQWEGNLTGEAAAAAAAEACRMWEHEVSRGDSEDNARSRGVHGKPVALVSSPGTHEEECKRFCRTLEAEWKLPLNSVFYWLPDRPCGCGFCSGRKKTGSGTCLKGKH
jgi:hypothetical protein